MAPPPSIGSPPEVQRLRRARGWRWARFLLPAMPDTKEETMRLGQQLGSYGPSTHGNGWDTTLAAALACEEAGLDSVWLADHFMFPDREHPDKEVPVFDCFVALAGIAARTSRIRIGELVVGVPYRNPALLAKMLTTLD